MGCFSGRLMSSASDQKLFCILCSPFCCSFNEFVEEKVISPSYSSAILTPPPFISVKNTCNTRVAWFGISDCKFVFVENIDNKKMFKPLKILIELKLY